MKNQSVLKEIRTGIHDSSEEELIFILGSSILIHIWG